MSYRGFQPGRKRNRRFCEPFSDSARHLGLRWSETPWGRGHFSGRLLFMWCGFRIKPDVCARTLVSGWLFGLCLSGASGIAPVQWGGSPKILESIPYAGPHGKPRAYGGGVCAIKSLHSHFWPPVPESAFLKTPSGYRDQRVLYGYFSSHSHHEGSCFREGWHMHLEPPVVRLYWNPRSHAFTESQDHTALLEVFTDAHGPSRCAEEPCTFSKPHGHRPCP